MSRTYSIGCRQCRKHLWIAQASGGSTTLYTGEPHTMAALEAFLFKHRGHPLVFDENCESEVADWTEIEAKPEPPTDRLTSRVRHAAPRFRILPEPRRRCL